MSTTEHRRSINEHYGRPELLNAIDDLLRESGKDPNLLTVAELAPFDQFHSGGVETTRALLRLANLPRRSHVLDVGGGMGGTARLLAQELDCRVTVLDLTEEFCRVGGVLTARTGLSDRVVFQQGSALDIPFPNQSFDAAWMQNVLMNIGDKPRSFTELYRVIRPGGRLALQDLVAGPTQPLHYPVPWARDPSSSFLIPAEQERALAVASGFQELVWQDVTEATAAANTRRSATLGGLPPSALAVFGPKAAPEIFGNSARNYQEGRIANILAVLERC